MKDPLIFVQHILESIERIEKFMNGVSKTVFFKNEEKQSAVIRQIEIIGEAAKNMSKSFTKSYSEIPWKDIAGMRDKLLHHYFGVDLETVWKVIQEDLPNLKKNMLKIKEDKETDSE